MPLAVKNNAIILKDGKLAENCDCCGGWYCYGCGEGFKYSPFSGLDCNRFGTVSISGVSTYVSYANTSDVGCFLVQNGAFYQKKSTQPLCEVWVKGENGNACVRRYIRKHYYILKPMFGDLTTFNGIDRIVYDNDVMQTTLDVSVTTELVSVCDGNGQFSATEVAVKVSSELRAQYGYFDASGGLNESSTVGFFAGFLSENFFVLRRRCQLRVLAADKDAWPIMFDAVSLSGFANVVTDESLFAANTSITDFAISQLPTSAPVVISPQLVDPGC
jgi:hypothetical protein